MLYKHYTSVEDVIADAFSQGCTDPSNETFRAIALTRPNGGCGAGFFGLPGEPTGHDVCEVVRSGWADGVALVMALADQIEVPTIQSVRRRGVWADQGDSLDMGRVYGGQLETAWRTTRRQSVSGQRNVRIIVQIGALAHVPAADLRWRGITAIATAEALTKAGHNVEIIAATAAGVNPMRSESLLLTATTKDFLSPLELGSVCATTALPGFFRSIMWACRAKLATTNMDEAGRTIDLTRELLEPHGLWEVDTYLVDYPVLNKAAAQNWINTTLESFQ